MPSSRVIQGVLLGLGLGLGGCKPELAGELPICAAQVAGERAAEAKAQELPAELWYAILLADFDREQMLAGADPKDCTGASTLVPTAPPPLDPSSSEPAQVSPCPLGEHAEATPLPPRALTDADLILDPGPGQTSLVWVMASHYADGTASGPVAVVEWVPNGIAVRALGSLRAEREGARLRVEAAAGQRILVAEGDACPSADAGPCTRIVRLLPILAGRITSVPLVGDGPEAEPGAHTCLGAPAFALFEQHTAKLDDGRLRRFEIVRSVRFDGGVAEVAEQVVIEDSDPTQPEAPAQQFRAAANQRPLRFEAQQVHTRPSLWADMIASYGAVD
jgi:hypothetical protein